MCAACTNSPGVYGVFSGPGTTATNCPVTCNAGTYLSGGTCTPCAVGTYSAGGSATACTACVATLGLGYAFTSNGVSSSTCAVGCKANYVPRSLVITNTNKMLDWNGTLQAKIFSTTAATPEGFLMSPDQATVLYVTSPTAPKIWKSTISEGSFSQSASFASVGTLSFGATVSKIMFTDVWFSGDTYVIGLDTVGAGYWRLLKYTLSSNTWAVNSWYMSGSYPNPVIFAFNKLGTIAYMGYQTYLLSYTIATPATAPATILSGFSNIGSGVLGLSPTNVFMLVFDAYSIKKVVMSGLTVTTLAGVTGSAASSDVDGVGTVANFKTPVKSFAFSPDEAFAFMATAVGVRKIEIATGVVTTMSAATASYITMWNPCLPCSPSCPVGKLLLANCSALSDLVCGSCANCSLGTYYVSQCTSDLGPPVCTNCSAGTFANTVNQINCTACALGSYASSSGLSVCTTCPVGSTTLSTGATSVSQCICAQDYYQSGTACVACRACPNGFVDVRCPVGATSDVSTCKCNAGYYMSGTTCTACRTCPANSNLSSSCPANSTSDTSVCTCNAGYFGTGLAACTACRTCPSNAFLTNFCPSNSTTDVSTCACNSGYFGNGLTACTACRACGSNAHSTSTCGLGSLTDTSTCGCDAGYYGDGYSCALCRACAALAVPTRTCPSGSTADVATCACNSGYFGSGFACAACRTCSGVATPTRTCDPGSTADVATCACNAGYYGTGFTCGACASCAANARQTASCPAGSTADVSQCVCNAGFSGAGQVACPACPLNAYCTGETGGAQSCPPNTVTQSTGAVSSSSCVCGGGFQCTTKRNVTLALSLAMTRAQFDAVQSQLISQVASAAGVAASDVTVVVEEVWDRR